MTMEDKIIILEHICNKLFTIMYMVDFVNEAVILHTGNNHEGIVSKR